MHTHSNHAGKPPRDHPTDEMHKNPTHTDIHTHTCTHTAITRESHHVIIPDAKHQANRRIEAENRCISCVTVDIPSTGESSFCITHLDQLSDALRTEQVREILDHIAAEKLGPHVFCGDFNVFQKSDCSKDNWDKIVYDAESKGWTPPPETTEAIVELKKAGYVDSFYESDNHKYGRLELDVDGMAGDSRHPGATCWVVKPLLRIDYVSACVCVCV
jgi:exonuclease III